VSTELSVRRARDLDPEQIARLVDILVAVVADGASVGFLPPLERAAAEEYWRGVLRSGIALLVAELAGRVVGTAQLQLAPQANARHRAEVAKVLVDPAHQRRGIGRALLAGIEDVARTEERSLLVLDTREGDPSNRLYQAAGYQEAGRIPRYARSADGRLAGTVLYFKEI
jgi:ribosomal protein S18 acetylase RimI-like enzyme